MAVEEHVIELVVSGADDAQEAADAAEALEDSVTAAARAADTASGSLDDAAKAATKLAKGASAATTNFGEIEGALGKLGGPVGKLGQLGFGTADAFQKLGKNFQGSKLYAAVAAVGIGLVAVAAVAAAGAVAALLGKLVSLAVSGSDAANKADVLREAMTGSAASAAELSATTASVASRVPLAAAEVSKLADDLWKAGKRGKALEESLLAASYEAAGLGKNPGPALIAKRMANLDVIGARFKDSLAQIFAGPSTKAATGKFTSALGGVADLFGQNHSEGRGLQKLLSVVVDPLIDGLTAALPLAKQVFRGMIIAALDVAIAVVSARNAILRLIPDEVKTAIKDFAGSQTALNVALEAGKAVLIAVAAVGVVLGGILAAIVLAIGVCVAAFFAFTSAAKQLGAVLGSMISSAMQALTSFSESGDSIASGLINGLVGGIRAGVGAVVDAVRALASSAVSAITSALRIGSPSKVFEDLGEFTGEGFAVGVENQTAPVQSSLETMVAPPRPASGDFAAGMAPGGASRPGGGGVDLSGATFIFHGVQGAEQGASLFEEALMRVLNGDAIAEGAA